MGRGEFSGGRGGGGRGRGGGRGGGRGRGGGGGFGRGGRGGGGRGGRGGRGGGRGGFARFVEPPAEDNTQEIGKLIHRIDDQLVFESLSSADDVPHFNAPIFSKSEFNKSFEQIGQIEEVFGTLSEVHFSVKLDDEHRSKTFETGYKVWILNAKLLTKDKFAPVPGKMEVKTPGQRGKRGGGRGGGGRGRGGFGGRGGRGGGRGGRGRGGRGGSPFKKFGDRGGSRGGGRGGRGGFGGGSRGRGGGRGRGRGRY